jgi:hypothetical protein
MNISSIIKSIIKTEKRAVERGWDKVFYFFDIHETILYPDYNNEDDLVFYPYALPVLQHLSKQDNICMCLFTCSYPKEIQRYIEFFKSHNINFEMVNRNIEVKNNAYGYYEQKPYFNVLFEDKAGFDAEEDWKDLTIYYNVMSDVEKEMIFDIRDRIDPILPQDTYDGEPE